MTAIFFHCFPCSLNPFKKISCSSACQRPVFSLPFPTTDPLGEETAGTGGSVGTGEAGGMVDVEKEGLAVETDETLGLCSNEGAWGW